jgi:hypothetical protein
MRRGWTWLRAGPHHGRDPSAGCQVKAPGGFNTVAESSLQCLGPFIVVPGYRCFAGPRQRDGDVPVGVRGPLGDRLVQVEDSSDDRPIGAWWDASEAE